MASLTELKSAPSIPEIVDTINGNYFYNLSVPLGTGILTGLPLSVVRPKDLLADGQSATPTTMVVLPDETAPEILATYARYLIGNGTSPSGLKPEEIFYINRYIAPMSNEQLINLTLSRNALLAYVSTSFFHKWLTANLTTVSPETPFNPIDYIFLVDIEAGDMDGILSDVILEELAVQELLESNVVHISTGKVPSMTVKGVRETYTLPFTKQSISISYRKFHPPGSKEKITDLTQEISQSSGLTVVFVANENRGKNLVKEIMALRKRSRSTVQPPIYLSYVPGGINAEVIAALFSKSSAIVIATDPLQVAMLTPLIAVIYDMCESMIERASPFGAPYSELENTPKDISEQRSALSAIYSPGTVVRAISKDRYQQVPSSMPIPIIDRRSEIYQASPYLSRLLLSLISYGLLPKSTVEHYSSDISTDLLNSTQNVLLSVGLITYQDGKYGITRSGRLFLKLSLSVRGAATLSEWLNDRPVFPGVLAVSLIEVHTTFPDGYYKLPRKGSVKARKEHTERYFGGFRYYNGAVSRSDYETLLNIWAVMTDEIEGWHTFFGDKSAFGTLRTWCTSNSIDFRRLRKAISLVTETLTVISTMTSHIEILKFKPRELLGQLRPIIQNVYSEFTLTYQQGRNKGYRYNFGLAGSRYFTYSPRTYLSTQAIYPPNKIALLDGHYVKSGPNFMGYIELSIDIDNTDVGEVRALFDPNSNWNMTQAEQVERNRKQAVPNKAMLESDVKTTRRRVKIGEPELTERVPSNSTGPLDNSVEVIDRSYGVIEVPTPPGNVSVGKLGNVITRVNTVRSSSFPTSDPIQMAQDSDGILFASRPSANAAVKHSERFGALRRDRYNKRPVVTLFTIRQDLFSQIDAFSDKALDQQNETRGQTEGALSEMSRYLLPSQSYDPAQDIGLQNYLTTLTRTPGSANLAPIRLRETRAISFSPVPIIPLTRNILGFNTMISFKPADIISPPSYLAPSYTLMTPSQIDQEFGRIGRLEELSAQVLKSAKGAGKSKEHVLSGTRKAFTRWFFNANNDGKIVGMYPVTPEALNKYSLAESEAYPFEFTKELLDSIPLPKDRTLEVVQAKVNAVTGLSDDALRRDYRETYAITDRMLYMYAYRYVALGAPTMSLAVMPDLIKQWGIDIELFGSLFNTVKPYASAFPDEPKSLGNFFELPFQTDHTYLANPPYDEELMQRMSNKLLEELNSVKSVTIYVVLPLWDIEGRKQLGLPISSENEFLAYQILRDSPYLKGSEIRNNLSFYDYFRRQSIRPTPVRLLILSNKEIPLPESGQMSLTEEERIKTPRDLFLEKYTSLKEAIDELTSQVLSGEIPFPYSTSFRISAQDQLNNFRAYNPNISHEAYTLGYYYNTPNSLFIPNWFRSYSETRLYTNIISRTFNWRTIDSFADMFTESERIKTRKRKLKSSIAEDWKNPKQVRTIIRTLLTDPKLTDMSFSNWRDAITYNTSEPTNYKMTWVKGLFYSVFGEETDFSKLRWLDISAGWGDRLGAALGLEMGYLGFDPNTGLREGHTTMIEKFGDVNKQRVIYEPFETYDLSNEGQFDLVFSSPPFFLQEIYPGEQQSTDTYTTYDSWLVNFLFRALRNAWEVLADGGYLLIHMGDNMSDGKLQPTNEQMNLYIEQYIPNSSWEGVIGLQGNKQPSAPVWVWRKVTPESGLERHQWKGRTSKGQQERSLIKLYPSLEELVSKL